MNIYLACPTTRNFSTQYVSCLYQTRIEGGAWWQPVEGMAIDVGRNIICSRFLKSKFDFLLMHDSDATWHPDAVMRLASHNLPVVSGVIFWRSLPTIPTVGRHSSIDPTGHHCYTFTPTVNRIAALDERGFYPPEFKNELLLDRDPDLVEEIDGAGAHFMLIRRDVIEKIGEPWYECSGPSAGEDFDFCRKVQAAGFKLYVDYSVYTGHVVGPGIEIGLKEFLLYRDKGKVPDLWRL